MANPNDQQIPLIFPIKGLVDDLPFSQQPPGTTRRAKNVRGIDPVDGNTRGAQRSGLSRWNTDAVNGSNKIQDMVSVVADDRLTTYAAIDPATDTAEAAFVDSTPSLNLPRNIGALAVDPFFNGCLNVKFDDAGNSFWLEGRASVVKRNCDGKKLFTLSLPVEDEEHLCRALFVDDLGFVFAGVSGGLMSAKESLGSQETARLFCYLQEPDDKFVKLWQLEPGAFIETVIVREDKLYTAQNDLRQQRSYIRVYRNIDSFPQLEWERELAFPINDIAINAESDVFFTLDDFSDRGLNPVSANTTFASEDWRVENDLNDGEVIWSHFRGDDVQLPDVVGDELGDNPATLIWRDRSGNGRHWYANFVNGQTAPTLLQNGLAGHSAIAFDGDTQSMVSIGNASISAGFKDSQRTPVPGYTNGMYAMVMVARLGQDASGRCVYFLDNEATGTSDHALCQNRANDTTLSSGDTAGKISYFANTDAATPDQGAGAGGTGGHLLEGDIDSSTEAAIITIIWDGGVDLDAASTTKTRCLIRVNGEPLDRCGGEALEVRAGMYLGHDPNGDLDNMMGEVYEMVVLARQDDSSLSEDKILSHPKYPDTAWSSTASTDTSSVERIEGHFAHRYGLSHILSAETSTYPHPYGLDPDDSGTNLTQEEIGPPNRLGTSDPSLVGRLASTVGLVGKLAGGSTDLRWVVTRDDPVGPATAGGIGYGVEVNSEGDVYTCGPRSFGEDIVRKIIDEGDTASTVEADGAWSDNPTTGTTDVFSYSYIRMDVDEFDNLYVPGHFGSSAGGGAAPSSEILIIYDKDGTALQTFDDLDTELDIGPTLNAVAVDPMIPKYDGGTPNIAEWVALAGEIRTETYNIAKVRLIEVTAETGSARTLTHLAVSGGNIYKVDTTGNTLATNGTAALASGARYVQSVAFDAKAYFADGEKYKVYNGPDDVVEDWTSESPGGIPARCKLIELYGGRVALAGDPDNAAEWYLSAIGDAQDFDFFPPVPTAASAVKGTLSRAGEAPDIITGLIPYSDDVLIFLMDSCVYVLRGNPNDGGVFDRVSHEMGGAFGRAWAIDDEDNVWWMGRKGGVFVMRAGSARPQRVTRNRIDRRLQDFDWLNYYVRAYYNRRDEGIHWFAFPFAAGGTAVKHWFHDLKNDAWWEDEFGKTDVQPTAALVVDGDDPDDRALVLGCEDSRLRLWDESSYMDDDVAMDSFVEFGQLVPNGELEYGLSRTQITLASDQSGALRLQGFASTSPNKQGTRVFSHPLSPGYNAECLRRMAGRYLWLRLRSVSVDRWAYESGYTHMRPLAHARPR